MKAKSNVFLVALTLFSAAAPLLAHHSFAAEFDGTKRIELTGVVTKVEWTNPHVWFYINVKDEPTGKVVNWAAEMGSPNSLMRSGWTRNTMQVGMVVTLNGSLSKDGSNRANGRDITYPDGRKLFLGSTGTGAPYEQEGKDADKPK